MEKGSTVRNNVSKPTIFKILTELAETLLNTILAPRVVIESTPYIWQNFCKAP